MPIECDYVRFQQAVTYLILTVMSWALCLDKQGYTIFAGCSDCNSVGARSLATRGSTRLAILQIDVTKQNEIDEAKEMIQDLVGDEGERINIVFELLCRLIGACYRNDSLSAAWCN